MPILVSDANIFIDLDIGELLEPAFALPEDIRVPELLFQDELAHDHPRLIELGLVLDELDALGMQDLFALARRHKSISRYDAAALALARSLTCPLLIGDARLRTSAQSEPVGVRGTIWLVQRILGERLISVSDARAAFQTMRHNGRRLPWQEAELMLERYSSK